MSTNQKDRKLERYFDENSKSKKVFVEDEEWNLVADEEWNLVGDHEESVNNISDERIFSDHTHGIMGSLSLTVDDHDFGKPPRYDQLTTIAYQNFKNHFTLSRTNTKKTLDIKDIAKYKILHLLPAKTLIRFRSVSMEWDDWIKTPLFAIHQSYSFRNLSGFFCQDYHWNHTFVSLDHPAYGVPTTLSSFLPESITIVSSSNGLLLCQARDGNNSYYVCNPATQDWKKLPEPEYYHGHETAAVLAFEPSLLNINANYHLICAVRLHEQPIVCFEVYSSETRSWSQSSAICFELEYPSFIGNGFYMTGVTYWETSERKVLAFDLKNDSFEIVQLPSGSPVGGLLTQMHDELCYIGVTKCSSNEYSIKIYGGMDLSLRRTVDVNIGPVSDDILNIGPVFDDIKGFRVLSCVDDGIVMILVGSFIYSCNLGDQKIELVSMEGVDSWDASRYLPYVNSLVCVA